MLLSGTPHGDGGSSACSQNGTPVTWQNQTVVIDEAEGQGFAGFKEYAREGEQPQKEVLNGVIGPNGDILIVDEDGTFAGQLTDGRLQGQYAESGDDAAAINLELSRQQRAPQQPRGRSGGVRGPGSLPSHERGSQQPAAQRRRCHVGSGSRTVQAGRR